jgi:hypothetical protein
MLCLWHDIADGVCNRSRGTLHVGENPSHVMFGQYKKEVDDEILTIEWWIEI